MQQAVGGLGRVHEAVFLHLLLEGGDFALIEGGLPAVMVQQELQRIQFAAQHLVLFLDLFLVASEQLVHALAESFLRRRLHFTFFRGFGGRLGGRHHDGFRLCAQGEGQGGQ